MSKGLSIYDDHGDEGFAVFAVIAFSSLPYLMLAWALMVITDGDAKDFWLALGVLLVLRMFFSAVEALGGILLWRLYGRRFAVRKTLAVFRTNDFPAAELGEDVYAYLYRVQRAPGCSAQLRDRVQELEFDAVKSVGKGWLPGRRARSAMQQALNEYARQHVLPVEPRP